MPMGLRLTISDSMERVLPDDTNVNGLGTWYVTLLVRIASTLAWYGGKDDNATNDTDKAPNKNSFHREQVHMHKNTLNATIRVDISKTRGWCTDRKGLARFICYLPAY